MSNDNDVIFFLHGKESGPGGIKIQRLAGLAAAVGIKTVVPDQLAIAKPGQRIEHLLAIAATLPASARIIALMGSSLGGYVATSAAATLKPAGLFLLAPAFNLPEYNLDMPKTAAANTVVVHGWHDEVIPYQNSVDYASKHQTALHLLDSDHRLLSQLPLIEILFQRFLNQLRKLS